MNGLKWWQVRLKGGQLTVEVEEAKSDDVKLSDRSNTPRLMHVHKKVIPDNHKGTTPYASLRSILSCIFQIIAYVVIVVSPGLWATIDSRVELVLNSPIRIIRASSAE